MITLSLLQFLQDNGFGVIDESLFWQKLGLDAYGVFIQNLSDARERGSRRMQSYELYSRGKSDVEGLKQLEDIIDFLNKSYGICELPAVPPDVPNGYTKVTIMPPSSVSSSGLDANDRIIYTASGTLIY